MERLLAGAVRLGVDIAEVDLVAIGVAEVTNDVDGAILALAKRRVGKLVGSRAAGQVVAADTALDPILLGPPSR